MGKDINTTQEFKLNKHFKRLVIGCLVFTMMMLVLGVFFTVIPEHLREIFEIKLHTAISIAIFFGILSGILLHIVRKLPYVGIAVDDDGIWYCHIGKKRGLISWKDVCRVKERHYSQCLELLDANSKVLIRIEYQLNGFHRLRNFIVQNTLDLAQSFNQSYFSKGLLYHLLYIGAMLAVFVLCLTISIEEGDTLFGLGCGTVIIAGFIYEYALAASSITITKNHFIIKYPFTERTVAFADVEDILINDDSYKGTLTPIVLIKSKKAKKPFKLRKLGVDANHLFKVLKTAYGRSG